MESILFLRNRILKIILQWINFPFRYADHVSIGDEVLVKGNDVLTPAKVINVSSLIMQGDYHSQFNDHVGLKE